MYTYKKYLYLFENGRSFCVYAQSKRDSDKLIKEMSKLLNISLTYDHCIRGSYDDFVNEELVKNNESDIIEWQRKLMYEQYYKNKCERIIRLANMPIIEVE